MRIWFKDYQLNNIISMAHRNMLEFLGIEFIELGDDFLKAIMPVDERTKMPRGLLHGGASCVLAESLGSLASYLCIDPDIQSVVGIEINANHLKSVTSGNVIGITRPVHLGRSLHVWDIRIHEESTERLVCVSRLTTKVLDMNKNAS